MKLKRLFPSIGIALVLLLGLMAGLRGVPEPVLAAHDALRQALEEEDLNGYDASSVMVCNGGCDGYDNTSTSVNSDLLSQHHGDFHRESGCKDVKLTFERSWTVITDTDVITRFTVSFSWQTSEKAQNPACSGRSSSLENSCSWYASPDQNEPVFGGGVDIETWYDQAGSGDGEYTIDVPNDSRSIRFECSLAQGWVGHLDMDVDLELLSINGKSLTSPLTDCVPIETLVVTGPVTGTAGQANGFKGTVSPPSDTEPIDWSWEASGEGLAVDDDSESYESLADLTWWYSGTKTVTTTACNCAGCLAVTNTIAITGLSWTPPFSTTFPTPPEFPPDCNCPDPSYFGILEVGHWINWLWCNLKCWILFFLDFLYWLWELLRWVFYTIANTFLFYLWVLTTSAAMQADMYFRTAANWVDESSEALGDLVQALVFDLRDKIHASMTKWADWVDISFDELGNWLQESVYNVRDWSHITLVDFGEYLNDFFTNLGEGWAGSIINIRDWSYDFLTMVGDFFASWGTNLGDFLAESTYEFRDWTYESLTNLANFVRDSGDNIGNAAEDFVLKIDEWLYDTLTKFGTLLNDWATSLGDYLSAFILAIDAWLYDALTKIGETLNAWIRFIGDVLASFLLFINTVVGGTLAGIYAVVAAQAYVFALLLEVLNTIVAMMHEGLDTIIFLTDLVIGMLTGVKDALDAQTKAELFQGEAFYFWRGLEFFESAIGDTPLAALNSVAIGLMGFRLAMWTAGQVADFMEDISRY